MSTHTPAKWKIRFHGGKDDGENDFFVEAKNNNMPQLSYSIEILGDDYGDHNGYPRCQRLADAKLIAAAPDLLEALQTLQTAIGYAAENNTLHVLGKQDIDLIDAAIFKATGE